MRKEEAFFLTPITVHFDHHFSILTPKTVKLAIVTKGHRDLCFENSRENQKIDREHRVADPINRK